MDNNPYELIGRQAENSSNPYEDIAIQADEKPAYQNILQRVSQSIAPAMQNMMATGQDIAFGPGMQFGNEFKKEMFGLKPNPSGIVTGDMEGFKDYAKDYFTDPRNYAMAFVGAHNVTGNVANGTARVSPSKIGNPFTGAKNIAKKTANWFAEPWQNESGINKFKSQGMSDIAQTALKEESQASKIGGIRKQVMNKYGEESMSGVQNEKKYLEKSIPKATHQEALNLQEELPALYGKQSRKFGEELKNLIGNEPVDVPAQELQPALRQSLLEHGILKFDEYGNTVPARAPISPKESNIFNMYRNFEQGLQENPSITVDASDLLKSQESMKTPFGKPFNSDDRLMSSVRNNVSKVLEPHIPGLKQLRSSHRPFLQGKYQSIKELNPFSTQYETGKASGFLQKYAKGTLAPDEKNLVGFLEKELGREIAPEAKAYGNRLSQNASRQQAVRTKVQEALSDIDRTVEDSITAIKSRKINSEKELQNIVDEKIRSNNLDKWKRRGAAIGIGAILSNTILKKVTNWYGDKPND